MTQEQKDLLLKDLCGRLPYGVKCIVTHSRTESGQKGDCGKLITICPEGIDCLDDEGVFFSEFGDFKPYLFPLSSMTKEQYEEWCDLEAEPLDEILTRNANGEKMSTLEHHLLIAKSLTEPVNYCYKNHFDIYGLIPMGLAIDATNKNIY